MSSSHASMFPQDLKFKVRCLPICLGGFIHCLLIDVRKIDYSSLPSRYAKLTSKMHNTNYMSILVVDKYIKLKMYELFCCVLYRQGPQGHGHLRAWNQSLNRVEMWNQIRLLIGPRRGPCMDFMGQVFWAIQFHDLRFFGNYHQPK